MVSVHTTLSRRARRRGLRLLKSFALQPQSIRRAALHARQGADEVDFAAAGRTEQADELPAVERPSPALRARTRSVAGAGIADGEAAGLPNVG